MKQKNIILKSTAVLMTLVFCVALSMPEEAGWFGVILTAIPYIWLFLFAFANLPCEKRGADDGKHHTK